ncbi:MAG: MATE family efflux transporter, partial [Candidatus Dormibacteraceae bacterium]
GRSRIHDARRNRLVRVRVARARSVAPQLNRSLVSTNTLTPGGAPSALEERRAMMLGALVLPTLLKLTFPVIAVVVAQTVVAILEAYWVSRLGTEAVAGVSLVLPLLILMGTMSNGGIGGGVSSAVARAIGAGRQADADALVLHTVIVALAFGSRSLWARSF